MVKTGRHLLTGAVILLAAGCSAPDTGDLKSARQAKAGDRSNRPALSVGGSVPEADREALAQLLAASTAVLASPALASGAQSLEARYPAIFLNDSFGYKAPSAVVGMLQKPAQGMAFRQTPVRFGDGAITGSRNREWRMEIPRRALAQWQSRDPVVRSCAINTVAHEVTHTFLEASGSMVFIDGGFEGYSSRRKGTTGSYVIGQLAQCTWLAGQGRIAASEIAACVPVFYAMPGPMPWSRGKFAVGRCDDFADGRPVRLP